MTPYVIVLDGIAHEVTLVGGWQGEPSMNGYYVLCLFWPWYRQYAETGSTTNKPQCFVESDRVEGWPTCLTCLATIHRT